MCNKWINVVLAAIILIFAFWETTYSKWVIAVAAIVLIIYALVCKCSGTTSTTITPAKTIAPVKEKTPTKKKK